MEKKRSSEVVLANALLTALEALVPKIQELFKSGNVTKEEQQQVRDRYNALRAAGDSAFTGPEWEIEPDYTATQTSPALTGTEIDTK